MDAKQARKRARERVGKTAKRSSKNAPDLYTVGDHTRYIDRSGVSFPVGKLIAVPGHDVVVEYAAGIDIRLDHRDPGPRKLRFC